MMYRTYTSEIVSSPWKYANTQQSIPETPELPKEFFTLIYRVPLPQLISLLITSIITVICFGSIYLSVKENIILIDPFYSIFGLIASIGLSITNLIGIFVGNNEK